MVSWNYGTLSRAMREKIFDTLEDEQVSAMKRDGYQTGLAGK